MQVDTRAGAHRRTSSWTTLARSAALTAVGALLVVSSLAVASGSPNEPSAGVPLLYKASHEAIILIELVMRITSGAIFFS